MILPLLVFRPRCEKPKLSVVTIIRQPHFRANEKYLFIVDDDTAVVNHIFVRHRPTGDSFSSMTVSKEIFLHADVAHNVLCHIRRKNLGQHLP